MSTALQVLAEIRQAAMTARAAILMAKGGKGASRATQQLALAVAMRLLKQRCGAAMAKAQDAMEALATLSIPTATPALALIQLQSARNLAAALGDASTAAALERGLETIRQVLILERQARTLLREVMATRDEIMALMDALS